MPNSLVIVDERCATLVEVTMRDNTGAIIPAAALSSLTATLWNNESSAYTVINNRNNQSVKGTVGSPLAGGYYDETTGKLFLELGTADNPVQDASKQVEFHRLLIVWTWNGGTEEGSTQYDIAVRQCPKLGGS